MPETRPAAREDEQPSVFRTIVQAAGIFFFIQFVAKNFLGFGQQQGSGGKDGAILNAAPAVTDFASRPLSLSPGASFSYIPQQIIPIWPAGTELDVSMYVSPSVIMPSFNSMPKDFLLIDERGFKFGDYNDKRDVSKEFKVPKEVQQNGTLYAHFYVGKSGSQLDPTAPGYDSANAYHFVKPLTQYIAKKKKKRLRNLISSSNDEEQQIEPELETKGPEVNSYYHPNFTFSFVPDSGIQRYSQMHPALRSFVELERTGARDASGQNGWYYPILYLNTFWQLKDHMTELNSTVRTLPLNVHLNNFANWKFSIVCSIDEGMKQTAKNSAFGNAPPTGDGSEFEEFKRILIDSNVYLLATTGVVSVLHTIFEMLAFKNDVSHWRNKKDNVGTSLRTILANVLMQSIIFLYLMDNNENTSWMILFGQGMGIAIEAWKITKTVNVRIRPTSPGSLLPYSIKFEDKHKLSETEKKTKEYDEIAFRYLYVVAVPLLLAYAAYSLVYDTHKSWYSFIITTLVGSVYAYGFLMMVPSLYINYRLKSVAHMPGKAMMYKFLNTFIDDLFAFTIKMPTLHRLATLRDDVIFFIYLYQSYKYKVDYTRVNEFGQGGEEEEQEVKEAVKPLVAAAGSEKTVSGRTDLKNEAIAETTGKDGNNPAKKRR